ncbi:hypothetical protein ACHBTE_23645 [Streptomyces sp. M41]|uniref:hypothetical protein n=1 Tax=Streptomyces sp. M41 TaxID=3059412 RepID=UPI00374D46D5
MPAHHATRQPHRLLLTATALATCAVLLRLLSPDVEADAGPRPTHSTSPERSPHLKEHKKPSEQPDEPAERVTPRKKAPTEPTEQPDPKTSRHPQQPPDNLPPGH